MFSDFENRVVGVPQIAPVFGVGSGNMIFDGPGKDEDFGLEQVTGNPVDRYRFRTSPLRNVALQPAFFHNGAYTRLRDAVEFHLDALRHAPAYDAKRAGVDKDLRLRLGPIAPVLERLDPWLLAPVVLTNRERQDLLAFLRRGLLDERATRPAFCALVPRDGAERPPDDALRTLPDPALTDSRLRQHEDHRRARRRRGSRARPAHGRRIVEAEQREIERASATPSGSGKTVTAAPDGSSRDERRGLPRVLGAPAGTGGRGAGGAGVEAVDRRRHRARARPAMAVGAGVAVRSASACASPPGRRCDRSRAGRRPSA